MKSLMLLIALFCVNSFGSSRKGDMVHFDVLLSTIKISSLESTVLDMDAEGVYKVDHTVNLPIIEDRTFSSKVPKQALWNRLKAGILLASCPIIGGERMEISISGKNEKTCKLPIEKFDPRILKHLSKIGLFRPDKTIGYVYAGNFPVYGIARFETNFITFELDHYIWSE